MRSWSDTQPTRFWLRAAGHGDIQIADYRSEDREGPPAHSHDLDEVQSLVEGEAEFRDVR